MRAKPLACVIGLFVVGSALVVFSKAKAADAPAAPAVPVAAPASRPADPKLAYAVGLGFGRWLSEQMKGDGITADPDVILRGVADGLKGAKPAYPEEQMERAKIRVEVALARRRAEKEYAANPKFKQLADDNQKRSDEFLKKNAMLATVDVQPSGVQVEVIKTGSGPKVGKAKTITANFQASLIDGTLIRASDPGKPTAVATATLLPSLVGVLQGMTVGSKWRVSFPPDQAYGLGGKPPIIGPNQAITLEVEIAGVSDE